MNTDPSDLAPLANTPALPPPLHTQRRPGGLTLEPMPDTARGLGAVFEALLKRPGQLLHELTQGARAASVRWGLLLVALICLTAFGLVLGSFSGGAQWWATPVKLIGGMVVAGLLCLPSLYIFLSLGGLETRFSGVVGLLASTIALASLLLVGLAPVLWIFCQSTESLVFVGLLGLGFWVIALGFGVSLLSKAAEALGMKEGGMLRVWVLLFFLVTLQMSTTLRPLIGTADTLLPTEKRFFIEHWTRMMNATAAPAAVEPDGVGAEYTR